MNCKRKPNNNFGRKFTNEASLFSIQGYKVTNESKWSKGEFLSSSFFENLLNFETVTNTDR